jgi:hypothetical protein
MNTSILYAGLYDVRVRAEKRQFAQKKWRENARKWWEPGCASLSPKFYFHSNFNVSLI